MTKSHYLVLEIFANRDLVFMELGVDLHLLLNNERYPNCAPSGLVDRELTVGRAVFLAQSIFPKRFLQTPRTNHPRTICIIL